MRTWRVIASAIALPALFLCAGPAARAADQDFAPVPVGHSWDGLYAGVFAAYGFGNAEISAADADFGSIGVSGLGSEGSAAGILAGYNVTVAPRWVLGVEGDYAWADFGSSASMSDASDTLYAFAQADWSATLRGRVGYLVSPDTMFYVAPGIMFGEAEYGYSFAGDGVTLDESLFGFAFVGVGAETYIGERTRLRTEYLVKVPEPFDVQPADGVTVDAMAGFGRIALIYDLHASDDGVGFEHVAGMWDNAYVGVVGAHEISNSQFDYHNADLAGFGPFDIDFSGFGADGFAGGFMAGYTHEVAPNVVLGIEGELDWHDTSFEISAPVDVFKVATDMSVILRGRAGLLVNPSTMVYASGGLVQASVSSWALGGDKVSEFVSGWEVGGGIEAWLTEDVSLRAEYLYREYDDITGLVIGIDEVDEASLLGGNTSLMPSRGVARLGVAYHFPVR